MKTGKTTIASQFPKALLLAFEVGYLAIPGILAQPIKKWSDFKKVLKQLNNEEAHQKFQNIIVDTADIAYDLCEKYICNNESAATIGDIPYGKGYKLAAKEFDETLRSIPQMGYGLVMISHSEDKVFTDENGKEYNQIVPTLDKRPRLIVDRMSDIIGYAHPVQDEDGTTHTTLYMRGTPRFVAGSRFRFTPPSIEFTYQNLVDAIREAIDKEAEMHNGEFITDSRTTAYEIKETPNFDQLMSTFNDLVSQIMEAAGGSFGTTWAPRINDIVAKHLGPGKKVAEMQRSQVEQLDLIVSDLIDAVGQGI